MALVLQDGLTEKQIEFALGVVAGMPMLEAYRSAYNAENMTKASINAAANLLMDSPKVSAFIARLVEDKIEHSLASKKKWVRQYIIDRSIKESQDENNNAAARIKALELLGKTVGVMDEREPENRKIEDIEKELRDRLDRLVDITPRTSNAANGVSE